MNIQGAAERAAGIHYEVDMSQPPLGVGGMGQVFKGYRVDERTGVKRAAAVKFLFEDLPAHAIERAKREASVQIKNENLVEMFGFVEVDETDAMGQHHRRFHVASELLDGVVLYDLLHGKTSNAAGEDFPFAQDLYRQYQNDRVMFAIRIIKNVLGGLMALHDHGYVHRDIDPSNIMITREGKIKLIDFGIAKQLAVPGQPTHQLTSAGQFMGKAAYAAPELAMGDVNHQDETTDIYAMGMLLFELVTGHQAFEGPVHEVLDMQMRKKVPLGEIANKELRRIIEVATAKRQQDRFASAAEFRVALEQLSRTTTSDGERLRASRAATSGTPEWLKNPMVIGGAVAAVLVIAAAIFFLTRGKSDVAPTNGTTQAAVEQVATNTGAPAPDNSAQPQPAASGVKDIVAQLAQADKAPDALKKLTEMADGGDTEALYELALLYSRSVNLDQQVVDNIAKLLPQDNKKAHELNQKAVAADPNSYKSLYELGCDFMAGDQRGAVERDIDKAKDFFNRGFAKAKEQHDEVFTEKCQTRLRQLEAI